MERLSDPTRLRSYAMERLNDPTEPCSHETELSCYKCPIVVKG